MKKLFFEPINLGALILFSFFLFAGIIGLTQAKGTMDLVVAMSFILFGLVIIISEIWLIAKKRKGFKQDKKKDS